MCSHLFFSVIECTISSIVLNKVCNAEYERLLKRSWTCNFFLSTRFDCITYKGFLYRGKGILLTSNKLLDGLLKSVWKLSSTPLQCWNWQGFKFTLKLSFCIIHAILLCIQPMHIYECLLMKHCPKLSPFYFHFP